MQHHPEDDERDRADDVGEDRGGQTGSCTGRGRAAVGAGPVAGFEILDVGLQRPRSDRAQPVQSVHSPRIGTSRRPL